MRRRPNAPSYEWPRTTIRDETTGGCTGKPLQRTRKITRGATPPFRARSVHNDAMTTTSSEASSGLSEARWPQITLWIAFVILGSAGAWFLSNALIPVGLGYTYDPVANVESGPWFPWTYLVCGIALVVIAVFTSWNRYWPTVLFLPLSLTLAWSFTASREDMTGLWLVGLFFMAFGAIVGTLFVLGVTRFARSRLK